MVVPSGQQTNPAQGKNDFLDFFSQAIERYKKSVMEDPEEPKPSARNVPPKKRSPTYTTVSDDASHEKPAKIPKISSSDTCTETVDSGNEGSADGQKPESAAEIEKKRLASRVSSRRTREREKLRMDHFRNAKLKLQQDNKKLRDENEEIRSLIMKIKDEKATLERKTAVVQSMLAKNNPAPPQFPLQGLTPSLPIQPQAAVPSQQAMAALLLNAIVQPQVANTLPSMPSLPPAQPSQEQKLLSLLALVSSNPGLAHLLAPAQAAPAPQLPQQQPMASASLQGNFVNTPGNQADNNAQLQQNLLNLLLSGGGAQAGGQNSVVL